MYKAIRGIRIALALITMSLPTWALIVGYESVFRNMQILTALLSGSLVCLVFWIIATLIYGRIYCSVLCPLGTAMDCTAAAERFISRRRRNFRFREPLKATQWVFFAVAVALIFVGGPILPTLFDPYSNYARIIEDLLIKPLGLNSEVLQFSLSSLAVASVVAVAIICVSWRRGRLLCNSICPVGTLLSVAARSTVFHVDINTDKCINCGECERVCKAECINLTDHIVDTSRCIVCFNCTTVCPNDAITYRSGRHRLRMPLLQPSGPQAAEAAQPELPRQCLRKPLKIKKK